MLHPAVLKIRLYRKRPGDLKIKDAFVPGEPVHEAVGLAMKRLTAHFEDRNVLAKKKPHWAELVAEDGTIVERVMMTPEGPQRAKLDV